MSELRKRLEQGRREHREVRYPGDLGAELLGVRSMRIGRQGPRRGWMMWTSLGALGAVAATVAVVMMRVEPAKVSTTTGIGKRPTTAPVVTVAAAAAPPGADEFSIVPTLAGASLVPQGSVVPAEGESVVPSSTGVQTAVTVPAMPRFPSLSDVMKSADQQQTTTGNTNKEST